MSTEDWLASSAWGSMWPEGVERVILDETDSTMDEAARRAPPDSPTWIMARRQTAARGRRGRAWTHPDGNFAATLLMRPDRPAREAVLCSFIAAIALFEALASWADPKDLSLKWPNDVLLRGRKVAGILLESFGRGDRLDWQAVGIGVNLRAAPPIGALEAQAVPPIALSEAARWPMYADPDREAEVLLAHLAHSFDLHMRLWNDTGFETIRLMWLNHAARLGETITARTAERSVTGIFEDLDSDGCLVLRTGDADVRIASAEVYF